MGEKSKKKCQIWGKSRKKGEKGEKKEKKKMMDKIKNV